MKKVLFIQHTNAISGSAMSLLYTIQGLDRRKYYPVVALARPSAPVKSLYAAAGIETVCADGITTYRHTTGGWFGYRNPLDYWGRLRQRLRVRAGVSATSELVERIRPDLVHLNSVTLLPSAMALAGLGTPFVWHVRESPVRGLLGRRRRWVGRHLLSLPSALVFLSDYDRRAWTGRNDVGEVIRNFVDFSVFDRSMSRDGARRGLGLPLQAPVVLYLGGFSRIKGIQTLVRALAVVRRRLPEVRCVMPSGLFDRSGSLLLRAARYTLPLVGWGTFSQRVEREMEALGVDEAILRLPPDPSVVQYYAAADVVVFPSVEPHFARPIIEAGAMARPVVASGIGGAAELVSDEATGLLVSPGDPVQLASAITRVLESPALGRKMGEAGYEKARREFSSEVGAGKIESVYEKALVGSLGQLEAGTS